MIPNYNIKSLNLIVDDLGNAGGSLSLGKIDNDWIIECDMCCAVCPLNNFRCDIARGEAIQILTQNHLHPELFI